MTRKKFIKQLMACGMQRNNAAAMAVMYRARGYSYAEAINSPELQAYRKMRSGLVDVIETWRKICSAICESWAVASEGLRRLADSIRVVVSHMDGLNLCPAPDERDEELVMCKDCEHLMFSDCYGECGAGHYGIVSPGHTCPHGKRRVING